MVLPRLERIQSWKVNVSVIPRSSMEPYAVNVHADMIRSNFSDCGFASTIIDDSHDAQAPIEYPYRNCRIKPVLVTSAITKAEDQVLPASGQEQRAP